MEILKMFLKIVWSASMERNRALGAANLLEMSNIIFSSPFFVCSMYVMRVSMAVSLFAVQKPGSIATRQWTPTMVVLLVKSVEEVSTTPILHLGRYKTNARSANKAASSSPQGL